MPQAATTTPSGGPRRVVVGVAVISLCLLLGVQMENETMTQLTNALTQGIADRTSSLQNLTPQQQQQQQQQNGQSSPFQQAYSDVYNGMISETAVSCDRNATTTANTPPNNCLTRKRVTVTTFPHKAGGGLNDDDREFIADLYYSVDSVFEFGVGESTDIAAATNLPRYVGVDSASDWIAAVRERSPDRFRFYFADVGKTGNWGYPVNSKKRHRTSTQKMMLDYQLGPLFLESKPFDVYTVDGRWRVACVMASFLHAMERGANMSNVRVFMHDYEQRVAKYKVVLEIANQERRVGRGIFLSKKPHVTQEDIYKVWKKYMRTLDRR